MKTVSYFSERKSRRSKSAAEFVTVKYLHRGGCKKNKEGGQDKKGRVVSRSLIVWRKKLSELDRYTGNPERGSNE